MTQFNPENKEILMKEETEKWLREKIKDYNIDPKQTLEDMLESTTYVMTQYNNNPNSKVAKGIFESCIKHNKLFLKKISLFIGVLVILSSCSISKQYQQRDNYVRIHVIKQKYNLTWEEVKLITTSPDRDLYSKYHISCDCRVYLYNYNYKK